MIATPVEGLTAAMRMRREHPLRATLAIAEQALRAGDLATRDLWCVDADRSCGEAAARMAALGFDLAPLDERPLRRFVVRADLERADPGSRVGGAARPIDAMHMVTIDLGLADTLELLAERDFLFVIEGGAVSGLITLADLQRVPVGMMTLAIILATEVGLNELILRYYGRDDFLEHLSDDRRREALERYQQLKRRNLEASPIDVLSLDDRLRLVCKVTRFRRELGFTSRRRFESWAEKLKRLRDSLAHGRMILDHETDAGRALALVRKVRLFAEKVWDLAEEPGGGRNRSPNERAPGPSGTAIVR